jgi:hypothetical protein
LESMWIPLLSMENWIWWLLMRAIKQKISIQRSAKVSKTSMSGSKKWFWLAHRSRITSMNSIV